MHSFRFQMKLQLIVKNELRIVLSSKPENFKNVEIQQKVSYSYRKKRVSRCMQNLKAS